MSKQRKLAYLALISAALIWGIAPPVIKYTLNFISPINFLYFRFLIASLVIAIPLCLKINKVKPSKRDWLDYIFLGFLCTPLNLLLLFIGLQKTTAIDASLISITAPFLVAIGGAIFLKENVTKTEKIGIIIAVLGTLVTIAQPIFKNTGKIGSNIEGNLLVFLGTLVWVIFTLLAKKKKTLDPFILSSFSFVVGLIFLTPIVLFNINFPFTFNFSSFDKLGTGFLTFNFNAIYGIVFMAIFSSVIAYFFHFYGLSKIEASEAEVFTYLQPIFAVPVATVFLGEKITIPFLVGAILITAGVIISTVKHS